MVPNILTQEILKGILYYDENTGEFINKTSRGRSKKGSKAGSIKKDSGYITISIDSKGYYAHRLAWLYIYGEIPNGELDHIDGNKTNNRIGNLRLCIHRNNVFNSIKRNTTYYRGVTKNRSRYRARIQVDGNYIDLGTYNTPEEASMAYEIKAKELHGEFYLNPKYTYNIEEVTDGS